MMEKQINDDEEDVEATEKTALSKNVNRLALGSYGARTQRDKQK